ncbi:MAG: endopeptidase La [Clostridiales bacterium]|nr:endopeptidase La [Clostridiales bacterium]
MTTKDMDALERLPIIPLRALVIFPAQTSVFDVARANSILALEHAMSADKRVFLVAQRDSTIEKPHIEDLFTVGTVAKIKQIVRHPDGVLRVLVGGERRAILADMLEQGEFSVGKIAPMITQPLEDINLNHAHARVLRKLVKDASRSLDSLSNETAGMISGERDAIAMADMAAAHILNAFEDRQEILECCNELERLNLLEQKLSNEIQISQLEKEIQGRVHETIDKNNKDYFLREQIRVIHEELGDDEDSELERYRKRLDSLPINDAARKIIEREMRKISHMAPGSPETSVAMNYIEYVLDLPWGKYTTERFSLEQARKVLDEEHYGLEDVKKRILEYLAVLSIKGDLKGPVLCFVGPPGVGKTSIARSVAQALGRKFARVSLGGVHDEAEIRGHRRTYIGSMPGCIISSIRQADAMDPVILFDEIDKMAHDMRGDPASAMLEVLDSEQNCSFVDHYIEAPFDLSKVLFIATANALDEIPSALRDRMEIIEVPSYTYEEKLQIAKRHLAPKQMSENGLNGNQIRFQDAGLAEIIDGYTREAGVRELERLLGSVCRKVAVSIADGNTQRSTITKKNVVTYLGARRYTRQDVEKTPETGVVNALAWTSVGGETMPIEVAVMPGGGHIDLTGRLGDVMKESARTAYSYIRSRADDFKIAGDFHKNNDLHIHMPEGAVPKDGPSAGVALTCAMLSAITGAPARQDVAMTGEVTLRGKVLPIGGVKEKLMAAYRMGIENILLPEENSKDLEQIPTDIRDRLNVKTIRNVDQAIDYVLMR